MRNITVNETHIEISILFQTNNRKKNNDNKYKITDSVIQ